MAPSSLKDALRQQILASRDLVTEKEWAEGDAKRTVTALELLQQRRTGVLAIYASRPGEPSTTKIISGAVEAGWKVMVPVITTYVSWAEFTGWEQMRKGPMGIPHPTSMPLPANVLAHASIIIASCLAVGADGSRLGQGAGWWDKALPNRRSGTAVWTLARTVECVDQVPTTCHDVAVNAVITETGFRPLGVTHS